MIENPILSGGHPQIETYAPDLIGCCVNRHCRSEVYKGEGVKYDQDIFCGTGCIGEHLEHIGEVVEI